MTAALPLDPTLQNRMEAIDRELWHLNTDLGCLTGHLDRLLELVGEIRRGQMPHTENRHASPAD